MKRFLLGSAVLLSVFISVLVVTVQRNKAELDANRKYIETAYAAEIALIEERAKELPDPDDRSDAAFEQREMITNELQTALDKSEVFSASWSLDGHHGAKSLKPMGSGDGFTTYSSLFSSHDATRRHHLYFGKTFKDRALFVYEGWVPTGINKSYRIAFDRDTIQSAAQH
ncbi:MAG TPA: hypothetical protein VMM56_05610 [Planctomycetaceae bacterium]|nr:hypothetical protein [Planctomycetaceae bacterium]